VHRLVLFCKAKYLSRWRGKDGKWHYRYTPLVGPSYGEKPPLSMHTIEKIRGTFGRRSPGQGGEVKITSKHDLDLILSQTTFCMLSAGRNPKVEGDANLSDAQIATRHKKLLRDLKKLGLVYTQGIGQYEAPEDSIFIMTHDAHKKEMITLGSVYNQDSILFVQNGHNELIKTTADADVPVGKVFMVGTGHEYVPEADDYYTEFEIGDEKVKFTMNLRDVLKAIIRTAMGLWKARRAKCPVHN